MAGPAVKIRLDDSEFQKGLNDLKKSVVKLGGVLIGAFAVKKAFDAGIAGIQAVTRSAMAQEDAINRLNAAMMSTGKFSEAASKGLQDYASELQKTTRFSDGAIMEASALIQTLGDLDEHGLKRATKATTDLAAALKMDLQTAANLMGKAADGNVAALKRYGVTVEAGTDKSTAFANALAQIEQRFGGRAQADAMTFSGRMDQLKNSFDGALVKIGEMITRSPVMVAIMGEIGKIIQKASDWLGEFAKQGDPIRRIAQAFLNIGMVIVQYVLPPIELLWNTIKAVGLFIAAADARIIATFAEIGSAMFDFLLKPIQMVIQGWANLIGLFNSDLAEKFHDIANSIASGVSDTLQVVSQSTDDAANELAASTSEAMSNIFTFDSTAAAESTLVSMQEWLDQVREPTRNLASDLGRSAGDAFKSSFEESAGAIRFDAFVKALGDAKNKIAYTADGLAKQFQATIGSGLANSISSMGAALVKGENAFKEFGKGLLSTLGDILIQFGTMLISIGIGLSAVPMLFGMQGFAAVAAGTASLILGGALKAMAGAGAGGTSPASAGAIASSPTGSQGGGIIVDGTPEYSEPKARERGNAVVVNVHGNIFNNRETALEIAEVLNSAWGTNAVAVGGMA